MRRALAVVLIVLGAVLALCGAAAAIAIGPDDTFTLPETTVVLGDNKAITTTPTVLALRNVTMVVEAEASSGDVFVGTAHPVDAGDYAKAMHTLAIYGLDMSGVLTSPLELGDRKHNGPVGLDMWTQSATGPGRQRLTMALDGSPVQLMVLPLDESESVNLRVGLTVGAAFGAAVGVAVVGLVLVAGGVMLWPRRRSGPPPGHGWTPTVTAGAPPLPGPAAGPLGRPDAAPTPLGPPSAHRRVWRPALVLACVIPLVAGCSAPNVPAVTTAWTPETLTKPALADDAALQAVLDDYEKRNVAADKKVSKSLNIVDWMAVDTGPLLDTDRFSIAYQKATKPDSNQVAAAKVTEVKGYIPQFSAYPMYVVADARWSWNGGKDSYRLFKVLVRAHSDQDWKAFSWAYLSKQTAKLGEPVVGALPSAEQVEQAVAAATEVQRAVSGEKASVKLSKDLAEFRADETKPQDWHSRRTLDARPYAPFNPGLPADGGLRVLATAGKPLVMASYVLTATSYAKAGQTLVWNDAYAKIYGSRASYALTSYMTLTVLFELDPDGKAVIQGWRVNDMMAG